MAERIEVLTLGNSKAHCFRLCSYTSRKRERGFEAAFAKLLCPHVLVSEAEEWLDEKTVLRPCEGFDLTTLRVPSDYLQAANNASTLQIIEDCMAVWIEQIGQVALACESRVN